MIVIYTSEVTNRLKYTLDFVFHRHFGIQYEITEKSDISVNQDIILINYSSVNLPNSLSIFPYGLLFQEDISEQHIIVSRENDYGIFFRTTDKYDIQFDLFSCIFYLLSRYEEYLPHLKDEQHRYKSTNSVLSNTAFNFEPVIEIWLNDLKSKLIQLKPDIKFNKLQFEFQATFDIDNAYKYKGRNWIKNPPNFFKKETRRVLLNKQKDPFDTFDFIVENTQNLKSPPIFFFLLNDNDKQNSNVNPNSKVLQSKIIEIYHSTFTKEIGIHFSYDAFKIESFSDEKKQLTTIFSTPDFPLIRARQHFLRITFPDYFRAIIEAGIQIDYSLAYPDIIGYRAGYSRAFFFFDLLKNEVTNLQIQPSCFMDATLEYYRNNNKDDNKIETLNFLNKIMKINSKLVAIFHNDLFADEFYRGLFIDILQQEKQGV